MGGALETPSCRTCNVRPWWGSTSEQFVAEGGATETSCWETGSGRTSSSRSMKVCVFPFLPLEGTLDLQTLLRHLKKGHIPALKIVSHLFPDFTFTHAEHVPQLGSKQSSHLLQDKRRISEICKCPVSELQILSATSR